MKKFIRDIDDHAKLYIDNKSGIAVIEDGRSGCGFTCHPSIDKTGSLRGMKKNGGWRKEDRCVRTMGFIINTDIFAIDKDNKYDRIVAEECRCQACLERREKRDLSDKPNKNKKDSVYQSR